MSRYFKKFKIYAFRSFAVLLSAALAVMACCFSSGLTAHAAAFYEKSVIYKDNIQIIYNASMDQLVPTTFVDGVGSNYSSATYEYDLGLYVDFYKTDAYNGKYITGYLKIPLVFSASSTASVIQQYVNFDFSNSNTERFFSSGFPFGNTAYIYLYFDNYYLDPSGENLMSFPVPVKATFALNIAAASGASYLSVSVSQGSNSVISNISASDSASGDLSSSIASSINASTSIQEIISLLSSISSDTHLLSSVLSKLDNINGVLSSIYSEVQKGNSSLIMLISALSGVDVSGLNLSAVQTAMYNNWVSIIRDAINKNAPDVSGVGDKQQIANNQLTTNDELESQAFGFADNNISAIDFNVAFPGTVASSAVVVMSWLSLIWEKLGNLQFLVTATCLAGLLTIVLGVINKFVRSSKRD